MCAAELFDLIPSLGDDDNPVAAVVGAGYVGLATAVGRVAAGAAYV